MHSIHFHFNQPDGPSVGEPGETKTNPSVCWVGGRRYEAYIRHDGRRGHPRIDTGDGSQPVQDRVGPAYERITGCKVFELDGKPWLSFAAHTPEQHYYLLDLSDCHARPMRMAYDGRRPTEKNWALYREGDAVFALYSLSPLVILRRVSVATDAWTWECYHRETGPFNPNFHIGTPLQKRGQHWYGVAHEIIHQPMQKAYFGVVVRLDHTSRTVDVGRKRYAHDSQHMLGLHRSKAMRTPRCATYHAGFQLRGDEAILTYGINDTRAGSAIYPARDLLDADEYGQVPRTPLEQQMRCDEGVWCRPCRTLPHVQEVMVGGRFACPRGYTENDFPKPTRLSVSASSGSQSPPPRPRQAVGPGDRFHALLARKYGIKPCAKCREMIDRMNALGDEGCRNKRDAILGEMWERRNQLKGWRAIAAKLPGARHAALRELGILFDEAVG